MIDTQGLTEEELQACDGLMIEFIKLMAYFNADQERRQYLLRRRIWKEYVRLRREWAASGILVS